MADRLIGVLGGMGPEATAEFYRRVISNTPAKRDQDHVRLLIYSNPSIPDRTQAIVGEGQTPVPALIASARLLADAGVELIVMPCNTAHHFLDAIRTAAAVPVVDMIGDTVRAIQRQHPALRRVGVIATGGTVHSDLYGKALAASGLTVLYPQCVENQERVMEALYAVKAGRPLAEARRLLREPMRDLVAQGADALIAGCTEASVLLTGMPRSIDVFDPLDVLAKSVIAAARRDTPMEEILDS